MKRKYPMFWPTAAFLGGILAAERFPGISLMHICTTIVAVTILLFLIFKRQFQAIAYPALLVLLFLAALFHGSKHLNQSTSLPHRQYINAIMHRKGCWEGRKEWLHAVFEIESFTHSTEVHPARENILCYFRKGHLSTDRFLARFRPSAFSLPSDPQAFDYGEYMKRKHCYNLCWPDTTLIKPLPQKANTLPFLVWKEKIRDHILKHFPDPSTAALICGLCIGDKSNMDNSQKEFFRRSGCSHILAVSGLHIGLLYGLLSFLFFPFCLLPKGRIIREICILLILWPYAALIGFPASAVRAVMLLSFYALGRITSRRGNALNLLCLCAFLCCLADPHQIWEIGFQLSYLAVASILLLMPSLQKLWTPQIRPLKWLRDSLALSLSVQIGTLPAVVYHFRSISLVSIVSNLVIPPLCCLILWFFIFRLSLLFFPSILLYADTAISFLCRSVNYLSGVISDMPWASVDFGITGIQLLLLYAGIACLCIALHTSCSAEDIPGEITSPICRQKRIFRKKMTAWILCYTFICGAIALGTSLSLNNLVLIWK